MLLHKANNNLFQCDNLEQEFRKDLKNCLLVMEQIDKDLWTLQGCATHQWDDIWKMTRWECLAKDTINSLVVRLESLESQLVEREGKINELEEKVYLLGSQVRVGSYPS